MDEFRFLGDTGSGWWATQRLWSSKTAACCLKTERFRGFEPEFILTALRPA